MLVLRSSIKPNGTGSRMAIVNEAYEVLSNLELCQHFTANRTSNAGVCAAHPYINPYDDTRLPVLVMLL
ncbi:hypothetical protein L210DRAFT_3565936 [Boletus edulis BED1]|uniref:Uncharacterized protein n=1 Tax=Boletus edulis BED1 TaxID=1328754 RepID=A0AAD4BFV5_BOLED|nr:hypothetical protein L210DRAFT_3565936 [Boletus edulis BED1]